MDKEIDLSKFNIHTDLAIDYIDKNSNLKGVKCINSTIKGINITNVEIKKNNILNGIVVKNKTL